MDLELFKVFIPKNNAPGLGNPKKIPNPRALFLGFSIHHDEIT